MRRSELERRLVELQERGLVPDIQPGDVITVQDARGPRLLKRATSGVIPGADMLVVRACSEEIWQATQHPDLEADPWPFLRDDFSDGTPEPLLWKGDQRTPA